MVLIDDDGLLETMQIVAAIRAHPLPDKLAATVLTGSLPFVQDPSGVVKAAERIASPCLRQLTTARRKPVPDQLDAGSLLSSAMLTRWPCSHRHVPYPRRPCTVGRHETKACQRDVARRGLPRGGPRIMRQDMRARSALRVVAAAAAAIAAGCSGDDDSSDGGGANSDASVSDASSSVPDASIEDARATPDAGPAGGIRSLALPSNGLVFDPVRGVLYASVPSFVAGFGNRVVKVDPASGQITDSVFVGSEPDVMAIAGDASNLYVGIAGAAAVRRVNLDTFTANLQVSLGNSDFGAMTAGDLAVMPGSPGSFAVSRRNPGFSPYFAGLAIYDGGVRRSQVWDGFTGGERIEFADAATLYGYDDETTGFELFELRVDTQGVRPVREADGVLDGFFVDFVYDDGQIIGTSGIVVDAAAFLRVGTFAASGPLAVDRSRSTVTYLAASFETQSLFLVEFDRQKFVPLDTVELDLSLDPFFDPARDLIKWSETGFAFRTQSTIYFVDAPFAP
jgi:hypothetical protein